jgi:DNA helicase-2/ATP-dependent DNA helicase PcrA
MRLVADLHIHSHFSRATSKNLDFEHLYRWAQLKGVGIVGTGDIAHPGWLEEMRTKLEPAEPGLFRLKQEVAAAVDEEVPSACRRPVRFLLAGEISNIYKRLDKVRKVHNVIFAPDLDAVARIQGELEKIGNIRSDGRPILGLDSRDLFEIILDVDERCELIPAHIWTPWFSMLGSKSGFDAVEECFADLTPHIFALETGLSSDPPMNWRVSDLDRYTLVSSSDAHSPPKLAREATLFDCELSYAALFDAMRTGDPERFKGTIEFFPEEGKYHHDGHRKCSVSWTPEMTLAHDGLCSLCGKPVTVGVSHRVAELADRPPGGRPAHTHPFHSLIPLPEILSQLHGVGVNSKRVQRDYLRILAELGPELEILLDLPHVEIAAAGGAQLADGILRMREGDVTAIAGYDGEYGVIKLFEDDDSQMRLFELGAPTVAPTRADQASVSPTPHVRESIMATSDADDARPSDVRLRASGAKSASPGLNAAQQAAVNTVDRSLVIVAGPGTGKTRTLTRRIAGLVSEHDVAPETVLAITFTNKAAREMQARLTDLLGDAVTRRLTVKTFHALGAQLLHEFHQEAGLDKNFAILDEEEQQRLLRNVVPALSGPAARRWLDAISVAKNRLQPIVAPQDPGTDLDADALWDAYHVALRAAQAVDFDDLVGESLRLMREHEAVRASLCDRFRWISVDEYQDVNEAQYRLLRLLSADGANLCVIGDPDQAIYGFRGADYRYFLRFSDDYPGAVIHHLERNYRSTQSILQAAQQVIAQNADRAALALWSDFVSATRLSIHHAPTDRAEAEFVVHQIERMVGGTSYFSLDSGRVEDDGRNLAFGDFAVLYRTRAQAALIEEAFERSGMPYQTVGETPFFSHDDVRVLLASFWLLQQPRSAAHWDLLLNVDDARFSTEKIVQLLAAAEEAGSSLRHARAEAAIVAGLEGAQRQRLAAVVALLEDLAAGEAQLLPERLEQAAAALQARELAIVDAERLARVKRRAALNGSDLRAFLTSVALERDVDTYDPRADRIALMTLHAAKGLEFPVVFIVGCEEGLLPFVRKGEKLDIEEERRLFYVGMTRAQQKLVLSNAQRRQLYGQMVEQPVSRFVADIEASLLAREEPTPRKAKQDSPDDFQLSLFG